MLLEIRAIDPDNAVELERNLGPSEHTPTTEHFFVDPIYKSLSHDRVYEISEKGVLMNVFISLKESKWQCNPEVCRLQSSTCIDKIAALCKKVVSTATDRVHQLLNTFDLCSSSVPKSSILQGHPFSCYSSEASCISQLLFLRTLAPHFPVIRKLVASFYSTKKNFENVETISTAVANGNMEVLLSTEANLKNKGQEYHFSERMVFNNEDDIINAHRSLFEAMVKRCQDLPVNACMSCQKLLCRKDVVEVSKMRSTPVCPAWEELVRLVEDKDLPRTYVCNFCILKFRKGKMSATCQLNKLESVPGPQEIGELNDYEKLLIQRAKAFQTVIRMGSVSGRRQPHSNLLQKVVGRAFHLPLPTEQTLKKLPNPEDAIMANQELFVTVRGLPSKAKSPKLMSEKFTKRFSG